MSHRDARARLNVVCLRRCLRWLLAGATWSTVTFRSDCRWTPQTLTSAALLWAWSDELTLGERFRTVRKIILCLTNSQQQLAGSYQAFVKILRHWTNDLSQHLTLTLRRQMQETLSPHWRIGPADSSERAHLQEMLSDLPTGALVAADAGFVGYEGMREVLDEGLQFLIRVGSNVRLLKQLGWARELAGTVYLWPDQKAQKKLPPLALRLVVAHNGKHPVYLVTSVLSRRLLSDRQVVELYAKRWGIELFYRHLKQTFQRRKLLSTSAANARIEKEWSLLGLWAMALYALVETTRQHVPPERLSFAQLVLAFRRTLRDYLHPTERRGRLCERLRQAIVDAYVRQNKVSRNHPKKKKEQAPGPPCILKATPRQRKRAKQIKRQLAIRLTA